jgi:hypothetical protein
VRVLFKAIKGEKDSVDVIVMIRNLCGEEFETVDYRNNMYNKLYKEIYASGKGA